MASTSKENPVTVLVVHGAWHIPLHYESFAQALLKRGVPSMTPLLPTCDKTALSKDPEIGMSADAQIVENDLRRLILTEGREVLVVTHSYGGVPGVEAVAEELGRKHRATSGQSGGVVGFFCVSAFLIAPGTSLEDLNEGKPAPFVHLDADGITTVPNGRNHFFSDLDDETKSYYASKTVSQPRKPHSAKLTRAAYRYITTAYIYCEKDQTTPLFVQETVVKNMQEIGIPIREYRMDCGHSPFLSQPELLVDLLLEFVADLKG